MQAYIIAQINISDDSWVADYAKNVTQLVEQHGGRYLARTPNIEKLEGELEPPQVFVIIEFPSMEAARSFYTSAEYQPYHEARERGASTELVLVAGEDVAAK